MDAKEVMILITGAHKSFALYKAIEEGVNHMWTVSAFQQHANTLMICDEDATLELRVKTVKYFKVNFGNFNHIIRFTFHFPSLLFCAVYFILFTWETFYSITIHLLKLSKFCLIKNLFHQKL